MNEMDKSRAASILQFNQCAGMISMTPEIAKANEGGTLFSRVDRPQRRRFRRPTPGTITLPDWIRETQAECDIGQMDSPHLPEQARGMRHSHTLSKDSPNTGDRTAS